MSTPMKPSEALRKARELISDPKRWTRHASARNVDGRWVEPDSPNAVCWCSIGAICAVAGRGQDEAKYFLREIVGASISVYNDSGANDHSNVLMAFGEAIALAEEAGQ